MDDNGNHPEVKSPLQFKPSYARRDDSASRHFFVGRFPTGIHMVWSQSLPTPTSPIARVKSISELVQHALLNPTSMDAATQREAIVSPYVPCSKSSEFSFDGCLEMASQ